MEPSDGTPMVGLAFRASWQASEVPGGTTLLPVRYRVLSLDDAPTGGRLLLPRLTRTTDPMTFDFDALDHRIAGFMNRWGTTALRVSLALIFIWFGILKPLGMSPAEPLVRASVEWMPLFSPATWLGVIGWWEVAIGVTFLFRKTIRIAVALLAAQMVGTFLPLVMLPQVTFQPGGLPFAPTMEGQYIIKNLLIISAALVVGGTVHLAPHGEGGGSHPRLSDEPGPV